MKASELNQILAQHKLWASSNGEQGSRANLTHANLPGAYLNGVILTRADLRSAKLIDAKLTGADLYGANLENTNLTNANLQEADLEDTNLTFVNLTGANLVRANLARANLHGADLTDADLTGATLSGLSIGNAKFKYTFGLPDISWITPGCLVQLNKLKNKIWLSKYYFNFIQDSFGFIVQNNPVEKTFDMLVEDRIIRGIPDWVKYSGLKKISPETV